MVPKFTSSLGFQLDIPAVVKEILTFMRADARRKYTVIIGSDSLLLPSKNADFVTAIVVHRVGNGGRYFWRRTDHGKFHTLRDRIIQEVLLSLEAAEVLLKELRDQATDFDWSFEIHADVGENGPTNALIQEVVGMIRASNFEAKTKPQSYAASKVADRHV